MTRQLTAHRTNAANDKLTITVLDAPGPGGACHLYIVEGFNSSTNKSDPYNELYGQPAEHCTFLFQNGPIGEMGVNGITHEALLAILIDRMEGLQQGAYACRENALALTKMQEALFWLQARTAARVARGVEGTHKV